MTPQNMQWWVVCTKVTEKNEFCSDTEFLMQLEMHITVQRGACLNVKSFTANDGRQVVPSLKGNYFVSCLPPGSQNKRQKKGKKKEKKRKEKKSNCHLVNHFSLFFKILLQIQKLNSVK
jgi:hypothetical protein